MAHILVIKLGALGDFALSLSAMAAIREKHKNDHISLLTTTPFVDMAQRSRYFDEIMIDPKPKFFDISGWLMLRRILNAGGYDRVYDLQMNDRTALYYKLFKKKPEWSGHVKGASHYFDDPDKKNRHVYQNHKIRLKALGIETKPNDLSWMETDIEFFNVKKPYVLLVPGCAPQHTHKRWPAVKYAALAQKLHQLDYQVCILGTDSESDTAQKIRKICPEARDFTGQTSFYDIVSLAKGADFAVGNDTGPMHFISQSGCPVVLLFSGVTNPALSAPIGDQVTVLQSENIADITVGDVMQNVLHDRTTEKEFHVG